MTPYQFGQHLKQAAEAIPPAPRPVTYDYVKRKGDEMRAKGYGGYVGEMFVGSPGTWQLAPQAPKKNPTQFTSKPTPYKPQMRDPAVTAELARLKQQYPQFGQGDLQDIMALKQQNKPQANINTFINNTKTHYARNTSRVQAPTLTNK